MVSEFWGPGRYGVPRHLRALHTALLKFHQEPGVVFHFFQSFPEPSDFLQLFVGDKLNILGRVDLPFQGRGRVWSMRLTPALLTLNYWGSDLLDQHWRVLFSVLGSWSQFARSQVWPVVLLLLVPLADDFFAQNLILRTLRERYFLMLGGSVPLYLDRYSLPRHIVVIIFVVVPLISALLQNFRSVLRTLGKGGVLKLFLGLETLQSHLSALPVLTIALTSPEVLIQSDFTCFLAFGVWSFYKVLIQRGVFLLYRIKTSSLLDASFTSLEGLPATPALKGLPAAHTLVKTAVEVLRFSVETFLSGIVWRCVNVCALLLVALNLASFGSWLIQTLNQGWLIPTASFWLKKPAVFGFFILLWKLSVRTQARLNFFRNVQITAQFRVFWVGCFLKDSPETRVFIFLCLRFVFVRFLRFLVFGGLILKNLSFVAVEHFELEVLLLDRWYLVDWGGWRLAEPSNVGYIERSQFMRIRTWRNLVSIVHLHASVYVPFLAFFLLERPLMLLFWRGDVWDFVEFLQVGRGDHEGLAVLSEFFWFGRVALAIANLPVRVVFFFVWLLLADFWLIAWTLLLGLLMIALFMMTEFMLALVFWLDFRLRLTEINLVVVALPLKFVFLLLCRVNIWILIGMFQLWMSFLRDFILEAFLRNPARMNRVFTFVLRSWDVLKSVVLDFEVVTFLFLAYVLLVFVLSL